MSGTFREILGKTAIILLTASMAFIPGCAGKKEDDRLEDYICSVEKAKSGTTREIGPDDDYVAMLDILKPGDELVLHEGTYVYPFKVRVSGTAEKPIIIRGYGKGEKRPVFLYQGQSSNLCEIMGSNIVMAYLEFQPTETDVHAIRIKPEEGGTRSNITIENCVFRNCGGVSVDANISGGDYDNIKILNNRFVGVKATSVYIGEHSGNARVSNFLFEGNYIEASQITRDDIVGYGIELKLNVKGAVIRNNLILNTKGPGIMVYGAQDGKPGDANIVEGNVVAGSRTDAGIVVGAGPSVVKNNIVAGCPGGGISVCNYGGRNLFENVTVSGNTVALNGNPEFFVDEGYKNTSSLKISNNLRITAKNASDHENNDNIKDNIKTVKGDEKLATLVDRLKKADPDLPRLKEALSGLKKGPFDLKKLKEVLSSLAG